MKSAADLSALLPTLPPIAVDRTFSRRVPLADLLGVAGPVPPAHLSLSVRNPQFLWASTKAYRYNPPGIEVLYLGEGEAVAGTEAKQHPGLAGFDAEPSAPATVYHVRVKASSLLDLTSATVQSTLGVSGSLLLAPWRPKSPAAPTQILGQSIFDSGVFEGIRYRSAPSAHAGVDAFCVAFFKPRMLPTSTVEIFDPTGTWTERW